MLLRHPHLGGLRGWAFAICGYLLADAFLGTGLWENITLNACNIGSVAVAYYMLVNDPRDHMDYSQPTSFLRILVAMLAGSLTAGFVGAMVETPRLSQEWPQKFAYWASSELVNYIALLPLMINFPPRSQYASVWQAVKRHLALHNMLPALIFLLCLLISLQMRGLSALAIPVPALLWCALVYHRFFVSLLSFLFIFWNLLAIGSGLIVISGDFSSKTDVMSTRLGVALVALAPLFVSTALAMQKDMALRLRNMAERDMLTGMLNRRTFWERGEQQLLNLSDARPILAVIGIENLRLVNSELGHPKGDAVLIRAGEILQQILGQVQNIGRISGDRFAVSLVGMDGAAAEQAACDICAALRAESLMMKNGAPLPLSASIGLRNVQEGENFQLALASTELVLQQVKKMGQGGYAFEDGPVQPA